MIGAVGCFVDLVGVAVRSDGGYFSSIGCLWVWLSASGSGSQAMAALLEDWSVPERAIVLESESRNTYENAMNMEKNKFDRITVDPAVMNGQPCIRGMRLTVRRVVEAIALYPNRQELKAEYPELEDEDIRQALEFAAHNLDDEIISLGAA